MRFIREIIVAIIVLVLVSPALAATPTCAGKVVIGESENEIVTPVANRSAGGNCFNDQIIDTAAEGANYGNHGEFVAHVARLVIHWAATKRINLREAGELLLAAARSAVGRTMQVRVIAFHDFHGNLQSTGTLAFRRGVPAPRS